MDEKKIARINELARKAKAEGLTDAEIEERAAQRHDYQNALKANARSGQQPTKFESGTRTERYGEA